MRAGAAAIYRSINYKKTSIRKLSGAWHIWCPDCHSWLCCRSGAKYTLDGYIDWGQAAASLTTHRKIWHT